VWKPSVGPLLLLVRHIMTMSLDSGAQRDTEKYPD
jgi:hypothetical protein